MTNDPVVAIAGVTGALLVLGGQYRSDRIFAFVRAEDDPSGVGFHTLQLLIALGSGGVKGAGQRPLGGQDRRLPRQAGRDRGTHRAFL